MIYQVGETFVISSHEVWITGVYESRRAAKYAFRFDEEILQELQDGVNPGGVITFEMLQKARKKSTQ